LEKPNPCNKALFNQIVITLSWSIKVQPGGITQAGTEVAKNMGKTVDNKGYLIFKTKISKDDKYYASRLSP